MSLLHQGDQIGRMFTLGGLLKIAEADQLFGTLFSTEKLMN
jgi:hypothetical protein